MARFPSELDGSLLDLDLLPLNPESVSAALKGEVGLVQGKRRRKRRPWNNYNYGVEDPLEESGGGGDPGTKVTKLSWKILKTSPTPLSSAKETKFEAEVSEAEKNDTRRKAKRLLQGFCIKYGVDLLFSQEDSTQFTQHPPSKQEKTGQKRSKSGSGEAKHPEKSSFSNPKHSGRDSGGAAAGSGSGGGGKRPPPPPSTTESEQSLEETTSEQELTTDTSTTAAVGDVFPSRKKKSKRFSTETKHGHHHHHHLRAKRPRVTIENKEPGAILVHSFSTSGKPEKKSVIGMGKHHEQPFGKKKSLKPGASSFLQPATSDIRDSYMSSASSISPSLSSSGSTHSSWSAAVNPEPQDFWDLPTAKLKLGELQRPPKNEDSSPPRTHPSGPGLVSNVQQVTKSIAKEKDSEWLQWSGSEAESETDLKLKRESKKSQNQAPPSSQEQKPIQPDLKRFMESTKVLDKVNSIMGLNPYQKVVRSNQSVQVKWEPWSGEYLGVCLNALVYVSVTMSAFATLVIIIGYSKPQSVTHELVQLEYINHFPETLFVVLFSIILSIWAVSCVMELGVHYAEFFSRFNLAICLLKYDVTEGVHLLIVIILSSIGVFNILMTAFFFGGKKTEIVRDTMGFLGYAILRPFNFRFRESVYYPIVQLFGLVIFLYFFLSLNVVLLQLAVYGKALGNMGAKFNLRLAYALGKLEEEKGKRVKKVIPYGKLYAEHLVIVSLFRNLSQVNRVVFRSFLFSMVCEIVLAVWLLFDMFLDEAHFKEESYITTAGTGADVVYLAVPVKVAEVSVEAVIKSLSMFLFTMATYWGFGGAMHNAAVKLQVGIDYIRRHGLVYAKTSKERRFIISMVHSFTSKKPYWVGSTFHISRPFLLRLLAFIIIMGMVTISYRPSRTELTLIEQCNHDGLCLSIKLAKINEYIYYAANDNPVPPTTPKPTLIVIGPLPVDPTKPVLGNRFQPDIYLNKPPCVSHSNYPPLYGGFCPSKWSQVSRITLPYLYKPMLSEGDGIPIYGRLLFPFKSKFGYTTSCPDPKYAVYGFPFEYEFGLRPTDEMVDCFGHIIALRTSDDCGNLGWRDIKSKELPPLRLIAMNQISEFGSEDERFFCCYQYKISAENEVGVCNMPDLITLTVRCKFTAGFSLLFRKYAEELKEKRKTKDILASDVPFDDPERMKWTSCLCKKESNQCPKPPPTTTTTTTKKPTTSTTTTTKRPTTTKKPTTTTKKPTTTTTTTKKPTITTTKKLTTTKKPTTTTKKPTTTTTTTKKPTTTTTSITTATDRPHCLDKPRVPPLHRLFTVCDVLEKTGKWKDLKTISYPNVLKEVSRGRYIQHIPMGASNCLLKGKPQFPSINNEPLPSPPVFDCLEKKYIEVHRDDCNSPILPLDPGYGLAEPQIRVASWSEKYKPPEIRCCVDFGLKPDTWGSRDKALVCNMPSEKVFKEKCKATPTSTGVVAFAFSRAWNRNGMKREEMETAEMSLKCCCWHLAFVKRKYPRDLSVPPGMTREQFCKKHFESL